MSGTIKESTYYKDNLPSLIESLKHSISKVRPIIDQDIDKDIKDDKLFNVLKAKRQAAEDVIWTMKRIDELENELNDVVPEEKDKPKSSLNPSKAFAQKQKA
jgi:hypothetical protein